MNHYSNLNSEKGLIWRIVHRNNVPWILDNGLYSANSGVLVPNWVDIGNKELIDRRSHKAVPIPPGGTLSDYVPFYFTPFSPMMYNIYTGRGGVTQRPNDEIVILVSSIPKLVEAGQRFVFTDRHAYVMTAQFYNDPDSLGEIDWPLLQNRNFQRSADDPEKVERYQAEALVHKHLPISSLLGVVCYREAFKAQLEQQVVQRQLALEVHTMTGWYF